MSQSISEEIRRLDKLRREGTLSDDGFEVAKRRLLEGPRRSKPAFSAPRRYDELGDAANRFVDHQTGFAIVGYVVALGFIIYLAVNGFP